MKKFILKKTPLIGIFFALILAFIPIVQADESKKINVASEEWKDAAERDGTGLYWDILRAVFEPEGFSIVPRMSSYDGSVRMVEQKAIDAMVGAYEDEIENAIYPKNYFGVDIVQAVYRKGVIDKWNGLESIKGKRVAWIKGYSYDEYLDEELIKTLKIKRLTSKKGLYNGLNGSKLDCFLDAKGDIIDFFKAHPAYNEADYIRNTLLELKLFFVFTNNDRGKQLAQIFDKNFDELLKKGEIKKLYNKYGHGTFSFPSDWIHPSSETISSND